MKVSVVIPVHNAGRDADKNVRMLLAQTLLRDEFEVIWVDDGSTDDTPAMLDRLADEHPHFRVIHISASGWPGRPRNVGIDAARGEYVQLLDHDDYLATDALRHAYEVGRRNEADIVLPKQVSFRHPPSPVFRESRDRVDITTFPLWNSLKPHKMFRRAFLREHDLRFDDEPRRLEDAHFVMRAYFAARSVSIIGDYTCYYHCKREDGKHIAGGGIEPYGYYSNVGDIVEIVKANTEPGELRNRILHRFYRSEMLGRLKDGRVTTLDPEFLSRLFDAQHQLARKFPAKVRNALPPAQRQVSTYLVNGDLDGLKEFSTHLARLHGRSRVRQVIGGDGKLHLQWAAELRTQDDRPAPFLAGGERATIHPDFLGGTRIPMGKGANARVFLLNTSTGERIALRGSHGLAIHPDGAPEQGEDGQGRTPARVLLEGDASIDPTKLTTGVWRLEINFWMLGLQRKTHSRSDPDRTTLAALTVPAGKQAPSVKPSVTKNGAFVVRVGHPRPIPQERSTGYRFVRRAAARLPVGLKRRLRQLGWTRVGLVPRGTAQRKHL